METAQLSSPVTASAAASYAAPHCSAHGQARGVLFHPAGFSLWRVLGDLGPDAELAWDTAHGDEALYVLSGGLDGENGPVSAGSTLIVEAGVPTSVRSTGATQLVHFGPAIPSSPTDGLLGPADEGGRGVHLMTAEAASAIRFEGDNATSLYFQDGTCRTCRITFFLYDGTVFAAGYTGASHAHSQDEIMHVLDGELRVGPLVVGPGSSIAVPGRLRYSFRTEGPFRYLTYRADVSTAVVQPGSTPVLETVANLSTFGVSA
jgi:mannose-6-phosphate isomerase-like protein (cupin superfamily)